MWCPLVVSAGRLCPDSHGEISDEGRLRELDVERDFRRDRARVRDLTPNRRRGETIRDVRRNVQEVDVCVRWLHLMVRNIITRVT